MKRRLPVTFVAVVESLSDNAPLYSCSYLRSPLQPRASLLSFHSYKFVSLGSPDLGTWPRGWAQGPFLWDLPPILSHFLLT